MKTKMNPRVKNKWVNALRSGDYAQGKNALKTRDGNFCCLGVLCDIAVKDGIITEPALTGPEFRFGKEGIAGLLPEEVRRWANLPTISPTATVEDNVRDLSELNDNAGYDFGMIADLIEEQL